MLNKNIPEEFHAILRLNTCGANTRKNNKTIKDGLNTIKPTEVVYLKNEVRDNDEEELFRQNLRRSLIDF